MSKPELNQFYSQSYLNDQIAEKIPKGNERIFQWNLVSNFEIYFR